MNRIVVTDRSGVERIVEAGDGLTLMEVIRDSGFDELLALCGGCCSCATCHVYIEGADEGALVPLGEDEADLLESSEHRLPTSRLSCQIPMNVVLDGIRVRIAPED